VSAVDDEDSGPGHHRDPRLNRLERAMERQAKEREDELREKVEAMDKEISATARVQVEHGTKIETLIGFHKDIKALLKAGVFGLFGLFLTVIGTLVMIIYKTIEMKGTP